MEALSPEALRVLGCLLEKQATTPEQYPLTMNALLLACNQTSSRQPVVAYDASTAELALAELRERGLARVVHSPSRRGDKYRHVADEAWAMTPAELAVLAVLALRGPQTANELKTRTERYGSLEDLGGPDAVLERLLARYDEPFVARLPRQPGQRDPRWAHLLAGPPTEATLETPAPARSGAAERIGALEEQVAALAVEMARLAGDMDQLRQLLD